MRHDHWSRATLVLVMLAAVSTASGVSIDDPPRPQDEAMSSITVRELKKHVSFLASDELGGRYSFSPGNRIAARYLASQLDSYGYRGAARDGSFFQKVPITHGAVDVSKSGLTLTAQGKSYNFTYEKDYMLESPMVAAILEDVKSDLVFVGHGISSPKNNYDDYAGLDVKGKFVIATKGEPAQLKDVKIEEAERGNQAAEARGARGLIVISQGLLSNYDGFSAGYAQRQYFRIGHSAPASAMVFQVLQAGPALVKTLAEVLGKEEAFLISPDGAPLKPTAIPATIEVRTHFTAEEQPPTYNVVALLEGADPKLKDEYIVLGAHYDHLKTADNGDVYNGADDNASGTAAVLEMAKAFATGPRPRRSILVIFYTAEEIGLLGSRFFTDHEPLVPLAKVVANFDLDMVGRSGGKADAASGDDLTDKDTVFLLGANRRSTELYQISERANAETVRLRLDHTHKGPRGLVFRRSDHYNFDRHGIPVIWYYTGTPSDWHQPTDDVEKLDFEKMERIARLAFATSWRVANLGHRLVVDK